MYVEMINFYYFMDHALKTRSMFGKTAGINFVQYICILVATSLEASKQGPMYRFSQLPPIMVSARFLLGRDGCLSFFLSLCFFGGTLYLTAGVQRRRLLP
jgi:hypothetical protein